MFYGNNNDDNNDECMEQMIHTLANPVRGS